METDCSQGEKQQTHRGHNGDPSKMNHKQIERLVR